MEPSLLQIPTAILSAGTIQRRRQSRGWLETARHNTAEMAEMLLKAI
jgi:hypothetical protein